MQQGTQNTTGPSKTNLIIIGVIVVAAIILLPRLFGNNSTPASTTTLPQVSQPNSSTSNANISLGTPVAATGIDQNGCATQTASSFASNKSIYVVAPNSTVPQGTTLFVRLYRDNAAIEDAPEITANQDYSQDCINFVFQPTGANFTPGNYEAQFYVNGNAASSVTFNVQ
ncbi:MAG: hypothetical protein ABI970_24120 [Chloroflexota bacterium]